MGYGVGTLTFGRTAAAGTLTAVVKLTAGGTLSIGGSWTCKVAPAPSTTVPTTTPTLQ